jgi:hypothetical protein
MALAKIRWAGKHVHSYDSVTVGSSGETFVSKSCVTCGESRVVTRIKAALAKIGLR